MAMISAPYLFIVHRGGVFSLVKYLSGRLENSKKKNWCSKFMQFLEEHRPVGSIVPSISFKLSAVAAELSCHLLKFKLILPCWKSFLLYPPYGWPLVQALSYHFVFPVTPSHCFHFLSIVKHSQSYCRHSSYGTQMLHPFSDGSWEHLTPYS